MLCHAAQAMAQGDLPNETKAALKLGRMTALQKPQGGVRGIVTGDLLRRLVARTLAQMFGPEIEAACQPFQYALSTRAGTDCVGLLLRSSVELDPDKVILSLDGIGAYDHIQRAAMLEKLASLPNASAMLPFVRMFYSSPSRYLWRDACGQERIVTQAEGGEQGDPLMPALYALGQHEAIAHAAQQLHQDDLVCAFLDDIYIVTSQERAAHAFYTVSRSIEEMAGVKPHLGKLEAWSPSGGPPPPGLADISASAWKGNLPSESNGIVVLGVPVGKAEFMTAKY